jgi:hypothetical protein
LLWAGAILLVVLAFTLAVPSVRAEIAEFIQIGIVRIFLVAPTPTPSPTSPPPTGTASPPTSTPIPTPTLLPSVLNLAGETSLERAQEAVDFPIRLPSYPPELGAPDYVFVQDLRANGSAGLDGRKLRRVQHSLHLFGQGTFAMEKSEPATIESTRVNGSPAIWASGPYLVILRSGDLDLRRLIDGHVLIWEEGEITYRLETGVTLEEAVKIAESLQEAP